MLIYYAPIYNSNNVSQLANIKLTVSTVLHQRIDIPIKYQGRRKFAHPILSACSFLLVYYVHCRNFFSLHYYNF